MSFNDDVIQQQEQEELEERLAPYTDEMNPGYHQSVGGWCAPLDQLPEYPFGPLAVRGGIQYPTPKKETHMTENVDEQVLADARKLRATLDQQIKQLEDALYKRSYPKPPSKKVGDRFTVSVQFAPGGKWYEFLILRSVKGWYTTGQTAPSCFFENWEALVDWLRGPDVHSHGGMFVLEPGLMVMPSEVNHRA